MTSQKRSVKKPLHLVTPKISRGSFQLKLVVTSHADEDVTPSPWQRSAPWERRHGIFLPSEEFGFPPRWGFCWKFLILLSFSPNNELHRLTYVIIFVRECFSRIFLNKVEVLFKMFSHFISFQENFFFKVVLNIKSNVDFNT